MISSENKRTFIASMNKYNPYRIRNITESVYNRILQARETPHEILKESPRNPKTIYLPPVKIEESSVKILHKRNIPNFQYNPESISIENNQNKLKIDSFPVFSRSLDFSESSYKEKSEIITENRVKCKTKPDSKRNHRACLRRNSENYTNDTIRTMSAIQQREKPFKLPSRYRQMKSPWAFQTFKYFFQ